MSHRDMFPEGFLWGTATASYQIEGATAEGGRGESIWDRFARRPGNVRNGDTGDSACDSYHRYLDDVNLIVRLRNNAYRFSIAWPRVMPAGTGPVNAVGLDYYDRLVDALLEASVTPFVTLYHWDLPQPLQDTGGWATREVVGAFARYADATVKRLGDRVKHWATINEPWCVAMLGYYRGLHAPGLADLASALRAAHHLLLAHGTAMPIIRDRCRGACAGIVLNMQPFHAAMDTEADHKLAALEDARFNRWFLDPVTGHGYPEIAWNDYGDLLPPVGSGDLDETAQTLDYIGLNYYTRRVVHDEAGGEGPVLAERDESKVSARGWEIYPMGLEELLSRLHRENPDIPEFYVTENGIACPDRIVDGAVHDRERIDFLREHLAAVLRLVNSGVPVGGYFVWSLMDNFEWETGYESRFGLAYVDFASQERTLKDSGYWYARAAEANAFPD